ncbi:MAG: ZPR1 zinc finger domain-containing protein [Candidatus Diapherotrites archaeon]|nr:ZPR1 zinc finger domain-containing protein [Candidatus Diapherotrites archaeon]
MSIQCPNCSKQATLTELLQDIPNFGEALISNLNCEHCAYNFNDVMSSSTHKPVFFSARIENENDLKIKIVKSSSSFVALPELETEIFPSPSSDGYISNIEGLLERVKESVQAISGKKAIEKFEQIEKAMNAEIKFSVELKDIYGHGALIGNKVEKKILSEKEISELKKLFEG